MKIVCEFDIPSRKLHSEARPHEILVRSNSSPEIKSRHAYYFYLIGRALITAIPR